MEEYLITTKALYKLLAASKDDAIERFNDAYGELVTEDIVSVRLNRVLKGLSETNLVDDITSARQSYRDGLALSLDEFDARVYCNRLGSSLED